MNSSSCRPVRSSTQPGPAASSSVRCTRFSRTQVVRRSAWTLARAWSRWTGRGTPSRPSRPQSHILKVKMYGVAEISSTMELRPEQCTVPAGIRKWSCFAAG